MRKIVLSLYAVMILSIGPPQVRAEEGPAAPKRLNVEECVSLALANSRLLQSERHRLDVLEARMNQAFWQAFSEINVRFYTAVVPQKCAETVTIDGTDPQGNSVSRELEVAVACNAGESTREDDYSSNEWGPTMAFKVQGGIPIYTFGKMVNGRKALRYAQRAKEAEFGRFQTDVEYKVQQAYHAISGAREMLYTVDQGREHLRKAREKVESDLENQEGTSTQIDLLKLKVFENEINQYEYQSKEIESTGLAALRFLVGGDVDFAIDILDEPQQQVDEQIKDLHYYKGLALDQRPELKALKYAVKALEAKVKFRKAEFAPDLLLVGEFRWGWTPKNDDVDSWILRDNYNSGPAFGIGIALNYRFDLGLDIYRLKEAKAELAALSTDQQTALNGVMLEVSRAHSHALATEDSLSSLLESKKLVKGWISAVMQNHAAGLGSTKDVKDALTEYFKVMAGIHKLTHDYNVSLAELRKVTGEIRRSE